MVLISNKLIKLVKVLAVALTLMFYSTVAREVISMLTFAASIRADKYMVRESLLCSYQAPPTPSSTSPLPQWEEADLEEQQLRQKLHEMTDNISDHSLTSDEEESSRPEEDAKPSRIPTRPTSRASIIVSRLEEEQPEQPDSEKVEIPVD